MRQSKNGLRPCKVKKGNNTFIDGCYFHMFGMAGCTDEGVGVVAIVELNNGEVKEYDASNVVFEDVEG